MAEANGHEPSTIKVAVTQAEPCWLDLQGTVDKTCRLIAEAAGNGARLVVFPECWIPGYPCWIWLRAVDPTTMTKYLKNALRIDSPQTHQICACAAEHNIAVSLGFAENSNHSLYISQATIAATGELLMTRRKFKPTHLERTVFGDAGASCLHNVVPLHLGGSEPGEGARKVGALSCWEHIQPLLKYHTYLQQEEIHVAAWPPLDPHPGPASPALWSMSREGCQSLSQTYAVEAAAYVLHCTAVITQAGVEAMQTQECMMFNAPGGGGSCVIGPDGRRLTDAIPGDQEGLVYAELDMDAILRTRCFVDSTGHYSRPDLLWLGVDEREKKHRVVYKEGEL